MPPEPPQHGCAIHPVILWGISLACAGAWLLFLPALRWLCLAVDALITRIIA